MSSSSRLAPMADTYCACSGPPSGSLQKPSVAQHAGAFFPNSHSFVISGGEFTNVTNIYHSPPPCRDFRMIPLGDLDLRHEVNRGVIDIRRRRGCTARVYSARVDGRDSKMTVALYQGRTAEEVWRLELGRYVTFRHPNLVQVYAAATSGNLYATVFHDELLPLEETLLMYRHSPISTAYLMGNFAMDIYVGHIHSMITLTILGTGCGRPRLRSYWRNTGKSLCP
ncbi:hypothetical protein B0H19DRAFT_1088348 [Mycena capillaripes]|nr:hypothetical protein B0H19DRAFT_1088348 [Mycena capillaripes]